MFKGICSNELRDHILNNIDGFDIFVDAVAKSNGLVLDNRKSLFVNDTRKMAGDIITNFFEHEFFDMLENAMLEAYEKNYEAFVVKENTGTPNTEGETMEDTHE